MNFQKIFLSLLIIGSIITLKSVSAHDATFTHFANEQELNSTFS